MGAAGSGKGSQSRRPTGPQLQGLQQLASALLNGQMGGPSRSNGQANFDSGVSVSNSGPAIQTDDVSPAEAATSAAATTAADSNDMDIDTHIAADKGSKRKADDDSIHESSKKARVEEPAKLKRWVWL